MPKLIIGLVGQAGCGKGTVADILREQYGADYTRFSAILGDVLLRIHLEKTRENLIKLSEALRHTFGEDVLSYALEGDVVTSPKDIIVIDGIRRLEDIVALEPLPNFKLVAIDAPPKVRYERMKKRGEKVGEKNMTWEEFLKEEKASTEVTIPGVMARAWKTLSNANTREELETMVHQMMKELGF
ncbi:MAG: AAA family ATPase [Candidatus Uhrbacteria bacterium]|nr:AAA family ATPase [Candidatus Uhrbacteria bacterium]